MPTSIYVPHELRVPQAIGILSAEGITALSGEERRTLVVNASEGLAEAIIGRAAARQAVIEQAEELSAAAAAYLGELAEIDGDFIWPEGGPGEMETTNVRDAGAGIVSALQALEDAESLYATYRPADNSTAYGRRTEREVLRDMLNP